MVNLVSILNSVCSDVLKPAIEPVCHGKNCCLDKIGIFCTLNIVKIWLIFLYIARMDNECKEAQTMQRNTID